MKEALQRRDGGGSGVNVARGTRVAKVAFSRPSQRRREHRAFAVSPNYPSLVRTNGVYRHHKLITMTNTESDERIRSRELSLFISTRPQNEPQI